MEHDKIPIILVVDDEQPILDSLASILEDDGCIVETTPQPEKVLDLIGKLVPDLVFLDIFIPKANGLELLAAIKREYPLQKVIIISGYGNITLAVDALKAGAVDFLEKPFSIDDITLKINQHCVYKSPETIYYPNPSQGTLVGESYLFKELMHYIDKITPLDNHLMICGPRGVGKTFLAEYLHTKKNPSLGCTIINPNQNPEIDFSREKFSQPGTIIIKHIDALPPISQNFLAKILESSSTRARVMCLSHKNLYTLVTQQLFNEDLFYALSSTPVEIPSLNKRRFDIPLLVHHFINGINTDNKAKYTCSPAAMRMLRNYTWQEHCREIKFLLRQITTSLPPTTIITPEILAPFLQNGHHEFIPEQEFKRFSSLQEATKFFQKKFLLYQLKKNRYDLDQVSNALSMDVLTLRNELQRLNIPIGL